MQLLMNSLDKINANINMTLVRMYIYIKEDVTFYTRHFYMYICLCQGESFTEILSLDCERSFFCHHKMDRVTLLRRS